MADIILSITIPEEKVGRLKEAFKILLNKDSVDVEDLETFVKNYISSTVRYVERNKALEEMNNSIEDII